MKKLAILFLLTTVLAAFTFGQVSVKGEFGLNNLSGQKKNTLSHTGTNGDVNPFFTLQFDAAASVEAGPGKLSGEFHNGLRSNFAEEAGIGHIPDGDNFFRFGYTLAMGPGNLTPFLRSDYFMTEVRPGVEFTDFAAGSVTLGFGGYYIYGYTGLKEGKTAAFGTYNTYNNKIAFYVTLTAIEKLHAKYELTYGVGGNSAEKSNGKTGSGVANIAYLDVNYDISDALNIGAEVDSTHDSFWGFQFKPYGSYKVNDNVSLGAYFTVYNINGGKKNQGEDIGFTPGIWAKYTF